MILCFIIAILVGLIDAYAEVLRLIETKRWDYRVTFIKSWGLDWWDKWYKIFDSFHLLPGLVKWGLPALGVSISWYICTDIALIWVYPFWLTMLIHFLFFGYLFWYIRNIGMHIVWMKKDYRRWKYLIPFK